jgi:hypothetical protein
MLRKKQWIRHLLKIKNANLIEMENRGNKNKCDCFYILHYNFIEAFISYLTKHLIYLVINIILIVILTDMMH